MVRYKTYGTHMLTSNKHSMPIMCTTWLCNTANYYCMSHSVVVLSNWLSVVGVCLHGDERAVVTQRQLHYNLPPISYHRCTLLNLISRVVSLSICHKDIVRLCSSKHNYSFSCSSFMWACSNCSCNAWTYKRAVTITVALATTPSYKHNIM